MTWPRFEDGARLHLGDFVQFGDRPFEADSVTFGVDKTVMIKDWVADRSGVWRNGSWLSVKRLKPCDAWEKPCDAWEKLEEDAKKTLSRYWGCKPDSCEDCLALIENKKPNDRVRDTRAKSTLNDAFDDGCAKVGTYGCYVPMLTYPDKKLISVDSCLAPEIVRLNLYGAKTIGCCCGHQKDKEKGGDGFIQVDPDSVPLMLELGYEQLPVEQIDDIQMEQWCFKPKTDVFEMSKHKEKMEQ